MPAHRKTEKLEQEFLIVGTRLREIAAEMRVLEPSSRRRDPDAWTVANIVREFCGDLLIDARVNEGETGCLICGG